MTCDETKEWTRCDRGEGGEGEREGGERVEGGEREGREERDEKGERDERDEGKRVRDLLITLPASFNAAYHLMFSFLVLVLQWYRLLQSRYPSPFPSN